MTQHGQDKQTSKSHQSSWRILVKIFLPLIILAGAVFGAKHIYDARPRAIKKQVVKIKAMVNVSKLQKANHKIIVRSMGTVIPAREIILKAKLSGEVVHINPEFTIGGYLKKGEKILQIDREDYLLSKTQKQCRLVIAEADLTLERGRQDIAKNEWDLLKNSHTINEHNGDLALRKPQLQQKQAALTLAQSELEKSELNLSRTAIYAPFDCTVLQKTIDLGSHVSVQDHIATLAATDEFLIQISIPYDRLRWITIPRNQKQTGSKVKIIYGANSETHEVYGTVTRLLSDLEKDGRMARILATIKNPLALSSAHTVYRPLLLGDYVQAEIEGQEFENILNIHRSALRDGAYVWLLTDNNTLDIRKVDIAWKDRDTVLITNDLVEGQRIITSDLPAPVQGMALLVNYPAKKTADELAGPTKNDLNQTSTDG